MRILIGFSAIRQTALYRTNVRRRDRFDEFGAIFESLTSVSKIKNKFFDTLNRRKPRRLYFFLRHKPVLERRIFAHPLLKHSFILMYEQAGRS